MILQAIPWPLVLSQATKEWRLLNFHLIYWKLCKLLWNWRIESVLFCCNSGKVMNMESGRECTPPLGLLRRTHQRWPLSLLLCVTLLWNPFIAWPEAVTVFPTFLCSPVVSHPHLFLNSWSVPWLGSSQHPSEKLLKRGGRYRRLGAAPSWDCWQRTQSSHGWSRFPFSVKEKWSRALDFIIIFWNKENYLGLHTSAMGSPRKIG